MATTKVLPAEPSTYNIPDCLCGQDGCLGHERINGKIYVPGFSTKEAVDACPNEIVVFPERLAEHVHDAISKSAHDIFRPLPPRTPR